ncbi:ATP-binding cassette, subfamily B [Rhodovulum sp. ES.010]|uniref:ABC transporter ATP-binding protein n=1 Tax=Rhodovulum sp. ES.010 TaxID=1882821 RepID=UPI00092B4B89|nr:ABC transporter ATP-binding protein [Rhodovulum sp. ES.010]SIO16687.1 ATP-binding cassette, subfamily B [Rhodovulum sp. ES.010]
MIPDRLARWFAGLVDAERAAEGPPPRTLLPYMRWLLSGAWPAIGLAAVVSMLAGTFEVMTAMMLGVVIDAAQSSAPDRVFVDNVLLLGGVALFFVVVRPAAFGANTAMQSLALAPNINNLVLSRLHRWTLGQSVTFFDNDFAGRIAQKQMQSARAVTDTVTDFISAVVFGLASIVGSALLMLSIGGEVAAILAVWIVLYLLLIRAFMPRIRTRSASRAAARAMVSGQVVDTVTNIKTVKLFAHQDHEDRAALNEMRRFRQAAFEFGRVSASFRFLLMTLAGVLPVLVVGATLALWTGGAASVGDIAAAGAVSIRLAQMSGWISNTLLGMYAHIGEIEDGMRTLTPPHEIEDPAHPRPAGGPPVIEFDHVTFAYGRRSGGVQDIDLTIHEGEKLAIVGASGAGKSTLVALLMRLYDTEAGAIWVGGRDVREVSQEDLRQHIGMVTQETAMFNRSARDNILYGRPDASEEEMIAAAHRAHAHGFIQGLKDFRGRRGYDAYLGERGVKLSGGQRQRIALARALLKDAPILVLDEATSALDSEVEAEIQDALQEVIEGKTVLAIAHRLSTIAQMDRIVVLEGGRIVEQGSHTELLARRGLYHRFWSRQSGGFIGYAEAVG